jgi:anti-sigma factor ChrR (cupin superfamily)
LRCPSAEIIVQTTLWKRSYAVDASTAKKIPVDVRLPCILRDVEAAVARWREVGRREVAMTDDDLDAFVTAFEHSERDAARALVRS